MPGLPTSFFDSSLVPSWSPSSQFFMERVPLFALLPFSFWRLKFRHRRAQCTLSPSPPHVLYPFSYFLFPPRLSPCCRPLSTLYTHTHPTSTAFPPPLPYRLGTNSSLSEQMYTRVYILPLRSRFLVERADCCTYSMFVSSSLLCRSSRSGAGVAF